MDHQHATNRFYALVWPERARLLRVAQILTGNATEADDLAQETFIKAFKALASFRDGTDVLAWLMTILRNTRTDRLRAGTSRGKDVSLNDLGTEMPDNAPPGEQWNSPREILNAFGDQTILAALKDLPEEIRWTLLLVDVQGMTLIDAAAVLDVPVGTVKSRVHRGRAMLRAALTPLAREMRLLPSAK